MHGAEVQATGKAGGYICCSLSWLQLFGMEMCWDMLPSVAVRVWYENGYSLLPPRFGLLWKQIFGHVHQMAAYAPLSMDGHC